MADAVYLLRHAAPPANAVGRYWGRSDPGIDRDSLASVRDVSSLLWSKPEKLIVSPLARTMTTAAALADCVSAPLAISPGLAEADFGVFEGMTFQEAAQQFPAETAEWARLGDEYSFPGGESVQAYLDRARQAWEECLALPEKTVLAVTHGGIIAAWCCLFLRLSFEHRFVFRAGYAALTAFVRKRDGSGWELVFFNNYV